MIFADHPVHEIADTVFCASFPHHRLKRVPTVALSVLNLKLIIAASAIGSSKLTAGRAQSMPWHLMPRRVAAFLHISRRFKRFHFGFLTNAAAFLPEITSFFAADSACFFALVVSKSHTERPTNAMYAASSR